MVCVMLNATKMLCRLSLPRAKRESKPLLESTPGILFFLGCLHNEIYSEFDELCLRCAAVEMGIDKGKRSFHRFSSELGRAGGYTRDNSHIQKAWLHISNPNVLRAAINSLGNFDVGKQARAMPCE